jgi:hypothetical protein
MRRLLRALRLRVIVGAHGTFLWGRELPQTPYSPLNRYTQMAEVVVVGNQGFSRWRSSVSRRFCSAGLVPHKEFIGGRAGHILGP